MTPKKQAPVSVAAPPPVLPSTSLRYLTVQGAAAYLSTTVWNIRQLISDRKIPYAKVGKRFILAAQDLDNFFESQKVKAA